jgi:hypothetical protein
MLNLLFILIFLLNNYILITFMAIFCMFDSDIQGLDSCLKILMEKHTIDIMERIKSGLFYRCWRLEIDISPGCLLVVHLILYCLFKYLIYIKI